MEICRAEFVKDVLVDENTIVKKEQFGDLKLDRVGVDIVNILIYQK